MTDNLLEEQETLDESVESPEEVQPEEIDGADGEMSDESRPERSMGARSSQVAVSATTRIHQHVAARKLGKVFGSDCGYHLPADEPKKVRFPDVSFIGRGRLPDDRTPDGNLRLAPDLAAEVVSPNDKAYEVEDKLDVYLRSGVRLVWIIYPNTRTVYTFRPSRAVVRFTEEDTLTGEDVLPDFSCRVAELFADL